MVERIRISPTQMLTRDASNNVIFDSNDLLVKQGGGTIYLDGYKNVPVAYGGTAANGVNYSQYAGGFLVYSASLFGQTPATLSRWIPRPTGLDCVAAPYFAGLTMQRHFYSPFFQTTINNQQVGNVRWVGNCGYNPFGNPFVFLYPEYSWITNSFNAGLWVIPWSNSVSFTYTDNNAPYLGEYGSVSTFIFTFDLYIIAAPRAASYSGTL